MSSRILDSTIHDLLDVVKPVQEDWRVRFQVIDDLRNIVESVESLRGATVEPFGSFVSNLFTKGGDLDISVQLHSSSHISFVGKKYKQGLLADLLAALRKEGRWNRLQFVSHARVPILKLESKDTRISCDISVDNLSGEIKSKLLLWISDIDERFRDMVLLVKEWAKAHNINSPQFGSFNSYSLSLLVIFHFQTCAPPIFPPLKYIYPGNAVDDLKGVKVDAQRQIAETCAAHIGRFQSNRSRPVNHSSLSELFIQFLAKFSSLDSKASELGICPHTGQWKKISNNTIWMPKTYAVFVEDPFEQPQNSARAVSTKQLARITEAFRSTYLELTSTHQSRVSQLDVLSRPGISHYLVVAPPPFRGGETAAHTINQNGAAQPPNWTKYGPRRTGNGGVGSHQRPPARSVVNNPQQHSRNTGPQQQPGVNPKQPKMPIEKVKPVKELNRPQQAWRPGSSSAESSSKG